MLKHENEIILDSLSSDIREYNLSGPLLVSSSEEFKNNIDKNKSIMYIGQETNGWLNEGNVSDFESLYQNFLYNNNYNREFWKFIRMVIEKTNDLKLDNILWANAIICGKKDELGTPIITDKLESISKDYLVKLYKHFKPNMIVIASGPNNPYYEIIKEFLKSIDSNLSGYYPTIKESIISDNSKNIHYTYHPNYLNRKHILTKNSDYLKQIYKNL